MSHFSPAHHLHPSIGLISMVGCNFFRRRESPRCLLRREKEETSAGVCLGESHSLCHLYDTHVRRVSSLWCAQAARMMSFWGKERLAEWPQVGNCAPAARIMSGAFCMSMHHCQPKQPTNHSAPALFKWPALENINATQKSPPGCC